MNSKPRHHEHDGDNVNTECHETTPVHDRGRRRLRARHERRTTAVIAARERANGTEDTRELIAKDGPEPLEECDCSIWFDTVSHMSGHVVISYSRDDYAYVDALAAYLDAEQIPNWYDNQIAAGQRFDSVIQDQIDSCVSVVVVLTPKAIESTWVQREISYAEGRRKEILPLLLEPCEPWLLLAGLHLEDVTDRQLPPARFIDRLRELLRLAGPASDPSPVAAPAESGVVAPVSSLGQVIVGESRYVLEDFWTTTPEPLNQRAPSWLLAARYEVVDFAGRHAELERLNAWRDASTPAMAVKLVHGPGGQGKTRLAARFGAVSRSAGWRVVAARKAQGLAGLSGSRRAAGNDGGRGLLVIVDYAERWPDGHLVAVLSDRLLRSSGVPVRVLLLARPGGTWWQGNRHTLSNEGMIVDELPLPALADVVDPEVLFDTAVSAFARILDVQDTGHLRLPALAGEDGRLVLTIHMAALVAVHAHMAGRHPHEPSVSPRPEDLSAYLLDREVAYWQELRNGGRISGRVEDLSRAVYAATLIGPLGYFAAVAALERAGVNEARTAVDDHRACYPPGKRGEVLEPLHPDRLGEDFLALSTPGHLIDGFAPDPWVPDFLDRMLTPAPGEPPPSYVTGAVTVMVETARRWEHIANRHLYPLLRSHPDLAVIAGSATLIRLAAVEKIDFAALRAVESRLPPGPHVDLDQAIAAITVRLVTHDLAQTDDERVHANLYAKMDGRLGYAGLHEHALDAVEREVAIRRRLAGDQPDQLSVDLADALDRMGVALANLDRYEEALTVGEESIDLLRRCIEAGRAGLERRLANVLTNISVRYLPPDLDKAQAAAEEAVRIRRGIVDASNLHSADARPDTASSDQDLANLGRASHNLAHVLIKRNQFRAALPHSREDVQIFRGLVDSDSAQWKPDYARGLWLASEVVSTVGPPEEAEPLITEVARLYNQLSKANPTAYGSAAVAALVDLVGRLRPVAAATTEVVAILREIVSRGPEHQTAPAAMALGRYLAKQGDVAGAQAAYRQVIESGNSEVAPRAEYNLARLLYEEGDVPGARASFERVIGSEHIDAAPKAELAIGIILSDQGDIAGAQGAFERVIRSAHLDAAPRAAYRLGALLAGADDVDGAVAAYRRAIDSGHDHAAPFANFGLGILLAEQGDNAGARAAYERAIDSGHSDARPAALICLGNLLLDQGDVVGAGTLFRDVVESGHAIFGPMAEINLRELREE